MNFVIHCQVAVDPRGGSKADPHTTLTFIEKTGVKNSRQFVKSTISVINGQNLLWDHSVVPRESPAF